MATAEQIAKIAALRGTGYNLEEISEKVGLSTSAISYQLSKMKEDAEESLFGGHSSDIMDHVKKTLGKYANRYEGISSGTKYVVNNDGVWVRLPLSGDRLKVENAEKLKKLFLQFRGPGRARITDKGEILAYWNPDDPDEDIDIDDESSDEKASQNWCVIGSVNDDLDGDLPLIPELPNDPSAYKPGDIWGGPMDGMRYSTDGRKSIFRSHPSHPRWTISRKNSGLSKKIWSLFMELKDYEGGRFYITERGAVISNVSAENLDIDFQDAVMKMSSEQRQYLSVRINRTNLVPVFLGTHQGGITLQRGASIHDPLTDAQLKQLNAMFLSEEED
ncbi:MAG: hypothetical protein HN502_00190 [Candidatus Marinimicrobia bacterium]|jgi:hypothetical protein|nr:hypothetical protein [Candidatus Neomarinimicrobiota bacterium]